MTLSMAQPIIEIALVRDWRGIAVLFCALAAMGGCSDDDSSTHQIDDVGVEDVAPVDVEPVFDGASSNPDVEDDDATDGGADSEDDVDANSVPDAGEPQGCPAGEGEFEITAVNGDVDEGEDIAICGVGFGAQGPTYVFVSDMENGIAGEVPTTAEPAVGQWYSEGGIISDEAARSGDQSLLIESSETGISTAEFAIVDEEGEFGLMHFDEFFVSLAIRDLGDFPGNDSSPTEFSSDSSAKDVWVMFGNRGDNYNYSCSQGECNGNDIVLATHTGGGSFKIDGNNTRSNWWLSDFWQFEAWNPMSTYLKIDSEEPYGDGIGVFEHISPQGGYFHDDYTGPIMREEHDEVPPVWDRIKFGSWYRQAGDVQRLMDDIYIAIGDGAAARVEVANAPVMEDATVRAISTVNEWGEGEVGATLRLADLDRENDDLYLFVVTANNERSPGFPLAEQ